MDEFGQQPVATGAVGALAVGARRAELAEIVGSLESSLERIEAIGLSLVAALLDHAVSEAKRQLANEVLITSAHDGPRPAGGIEFR